MPLDRKSATEWSTRAFGQPRIVLGLLVFAAHVALILLLARTARHPAEEVVEVVFVSLPITPPDEPLDEPSPPLPPPTTGRTQKDTRPSQLPSTFSDTPVPIEPITPSPEPITLPPDSIPQIDWHAELATSARNTDERARLERERRTLSGLAQEPMKLPARKRTCPFEQCEPGWDAPPSIFPHTKTGRVEKSAQGEVIRWISDNCYQILITDNIMHRAMTMCQKALEKDQARGDLFDHMRDAPPPVERALDVP